MGLIVAMYLWRFPVGVSDCLEVMCDARSSHSAWAVFTKYVGLSAETTKLRPLRHVQAWWLMWLAEQGHVSYHSVVRGVHAVLAFVWVGLLTLAARPRTWHGVTALAVALMALVGMHTSIGLLNGAFPVNHFLLVAEACLLVIVLAHTGGGWWVDATLALTLIVATLNLESGLMVGVTAVACRVVGWPGITRRTVIITVALGAIYTVSRVGLLGITSGTFGERESGYFGERLSPSQQRERFGKHPAILYAYNVTAAAATVVASEPRAGVSALAKAATSGAVTPESGINMASSVLTTALIGWAWWRSRRDAAAVEARRILNVTAMVLVANAAFSFSYLKDEIMAPAAGVYALGAYVAWSMALDRVSRAGRAGPRVAFAVVLVLASTLWALRAMGLPHMLDAAAFRTRNDWAMVKPSEYGDEETLVSQLKSEALRVRTTPLALMPHWAEGVWGE